MRILIVDDDEDGVAFLSMALPRRGFEVLSAYDVASARALLGKGGIDALVCDLTLPDGSGENVIDEGVSMPAIRIVVSGSDSAADRARTSKAGFQLHLVKPIDADSLSTAIRQLEAGATASASSPALVAQPVLSNR